MLETIGYDSATMAAYAAAADATVGRVVGVDRGLASVLTAGGLIRSSFGAELLAGIVRDFAATPGTGDWVVVRDWPDHRTTIEQVLPRANAVVHRDAGGDRASGQVLCANADLIGVVVALCPGRELLDRVERLVSLARESGGRPVVVLTKADLVDDPEAVARAVVAVAPGVEVICCSTETGAGIVRLRELLTGNRTLALLGPPGAGKSALTRALAGAEVLATSPTHDRGSRRRTSDARELVVVVGGGAVIDTRGLREIGPVEGGTGPAATVTDLVARKNARAGVELDRADMRKAD